jgi:hypothetical protein
VRRAGGRAAPPRGRPCRARPASRIAAAATRRACLAACARAGSIWCASGRCGPACSTAARTAPVGVGWAVVGWGMGVGVTRAPDPCKPEDPIPHAEPRGPPAWSRLLAFHQAAWGGEGRRRGGPRLRQGASRPPPASPPFPPPPRPHSLRPLPPVPPPPPATFVKHPVGEARELRHDVEPNVEQLAECVGVRAFMRECLRVRGVRVCAVCVCFVWGVDACRA